ncbi:nuclear intron maturase 4, mitochondrial [Senna tora]|uniref:Nuclear intron maturase 4, mitochondrial n=1 Tax=Senna tora TaxID=362788 RepID=A0A834TNN5_9FABA|nr:nuclear intron maturase 4, mitochondrial [Senna tora]
MRNDFQTHRESHRTRTRGVRRVERPSSAAARAGSFVVSVSVRVRCRVEAVFFRKQRVPPFFPTKVSEMCHTAEPKLCYRQFIYFDSYGPVETIQEVTYSTTPSANDNMDKEFGKFTLAKDLACLVEESSKVVERKTRSRMELKRLLEHRIKKRAKEQYVNGKFQDLMAKVIYNRETLQDAHNCLRLNSNVGVDLNYDNSFNTMVEELCHGSFDVNANTFSISTRGVNKEVLVLPNLKLKVLQEAIRIALEVVYRPHFSKISHGCRSGRGHSTALKYICKRVLDPDWWFTLLITKKVDASVLTKLFSVMEDKIEDPNLYAMIWSMFDAQVLNFEFGGFPKGHGLPQEGVLSPILMNIYLDLFDREFYRLSMKYEAIDGGSCNDQDKSGSKLRSWFRRQLKGNDPKCVVDGNNGPKVYTCRFMDEMVFAISGSKDSAVNLKSEIQSYLKNSLLLDVDDPTDIMPCEGPENIHFLGSLVRRNVRESPAVKAVHKLKEKVELFTLQRQDAWNYGTTRIGKKWLGHGLKKVKESEIKHLASSSSILNSISCFRKSGMETDHWYKHLLKIWMQGVQAKNADSEEVILSKYVAEPSLPQELKDSYYEFLKQADKYISSETASTLQLLPNSNVSTEPEIKKTEIIAPICAIKKRLLRYGLVTSHGYPRSNSSLILQDTNEIIDWFSGIVRRWLRWYDNCVNFNEVKLLISDQVRKSCIRTLAAKYRLHETEIEKRFDLELSRLPSTQDIENEMTNEALDVEAFDNDEALMYGISYSGLCLLSLARIVTQSRPCSCFVIGCSSAAPSVYTLHVMERQKFPSWKTGFSTCIHPSLNKRRIGLCKQHLRDLYLGHISLQSIDFGAWKNGFCTLKQDHGFSAMAGYAQMPGPNLSFWFLNCFWVLSNWFQPLDTLRDGDCDCLLPLGVGTGFRNPIADLVVPPWGILLQYELQHLISLKQAEEHLEHLVPFLEMEIEALPEVFSTLCCTYVTCKFLRRKCQPECVFAPYFPSDQPQKFANVHRVFGASNVTKLLNDLPPHQREDAANSLAYEADMRFRDPVYGCVGVISLLQNHLKQLQLDLAVARSELSKYQTTCGGLLAAATTTATTTTVTTRHPHVQNVGIMNVIGGPAGGIHDPSQNHHYHYHYHREEMFNYEANVLAMNYVSGSKGQVMDHQIQHYGDVGGDDPHHIYLS